MNLKQKKIYDQVIDILKCENVNLILVFVSDNFSLKIQDTFLNILHMTSDTKYNRVFTALEKYIEENGLSVSIRYIHIPSNFKLLKNILFFLDMKKNSRYEERLMFKALTGQFHLVNGERREKEVKKWQMLILCGNNEGVLKKLRKAVALDQKNVKLHNTICILLCAQGLLDEAVQEAIIVVQLLLEKSGIHNNLDMALLMQMDNLEKTQIITALIQMNMYMFEYYQCHVSSAELLEKIERFTREQKGSQAAILEYITLQLEMKNSEIPKEKY